MGLEDREENKILKRIVDAFKKGKKNAVL